MSIYDQTTLLEVLRVQRTSAPKFWLQFFGRQINFETPNITWDVVFDDDRKLAPFVIPTAQGRPQSLAGYETRQFAPAYVKIKDVVDPQMHIQRMPGEPLGSGSMSIEQKRKAVVGYLLNLAKTKVENREEWLAAKAIIEGKVTIAGEDYPEVEVNFRRSSDLNGNLTGAARWSQSGGKPIDDLKEMRLKVAQKTGARVNRYIFGQEAWNLFTTRVDLKDFMDMRYGGYDSEVTRMAEGVEGLEYMGRLSGVGGAGRMDLFVNTAKYIDPDSGSEAFYLPQDYVVGVADAVQGIRCYGAIMDKKAGYKPLSMFVKMWENEDPSVEYLLTQSAPLMVPKQPDATFRIKVDNEA